MEVRPGQGYPKDVIPQWMIDSEVVRQAPDQYGGMWWVVSPFNQVPWQFDANKKLPNTLMPTDTPKEFLALNPWPKYKDLILSGVNPVEIKTRQNVWRTHYDDFIKVGPVPDGWTQKHVDDANVYFQSYNMGKATYYETHSTGWQVRFIDSLQPDRDFSADFAMREGLRDNLVAGYQQNMILDGYAPAKIISLLGNWRSDADLASLIPEEEALKQLREARATK